MDKFDKNVRYRGSLQNYLIDTGKDICTYVELSKVIIILQTL